MNSLMIAILWCLFQVTLLSTLGIVLSVLFARRSPALGAMAAVTAVAMVLAATVLVPIPVPQWSLPLEKLVDNQKQFLPSETIEKSIEPTQLEADGFLLDLKALAAQAVAAFHDQKQHVSLSHASISWIKTLLAVGVCVGIFRFVYALNAVRKVYRSSRPVHDERAYRIVQQLAHAMSCSASVQLRISTELPSPAVLSWPNPTILLPMQWRTWSLPQLSAVLAHELAHVRRHDFIWRVLATITQSIHFYHPLTHWLLTRLTYSQELAADQLAAVALGSHRTYSKALSELAIRQDDLSRLRAEPILLPTLSSHLIRRIKMLRAMECQEYGGLYRAIRAGTLGAIVLIGVTSIALRGLANPTEAHRVDRDKVVATAYTGNGPLFQLPPSKPLSIGDGEDGFFVIKVSELLELETLQHHLPMINYTVSNGLKELLSAPDLPGVNLKIIDQIAGSASLKVTRLDQDSEVEHKNQIMMGSQQWIFQFKQDIPTWKEWIQKNIPGATLNQADNLAYFQIPLSPAMGPHPLRVAAVNERTLIMSLQSEEQLGDVIRKIPQESVGRLENEWQQLDTGIVSILSSDHGIQPSRFVSEKPDVRALDQILDNIERVGFSLDWDDKSSQLGMRIRLCCQNQSRADGVSQAIGTYTSLKLQESQDQLGNLKNNGDRDLELLKQMIDILDNYEVDNLTNSDGTVSLEVFAALKFSLSDILKEMIIQPTKNVAQAPAETAVE